MLAEYEQAGGRKPLEDVIARGPWSERFVPTASDTGSPRPSGRWELAFRERNRWIIVVGSPGGGWRVAGRLNVWGRPGANWGERLSPTWGEVVKPYADAVRGVPRLLWIGVVAVVGTVFVWLVLRDGPTQLRVLAGVSIGVVALAVLLVAPRSMRALLAAVPQVALVLCLAVLATYGSVGAAQGLHVGWGWPVNVWRDLLENDSVLVALLDDKYVDHYQTCDRYGYCTDYYHYWITAGGEDWPVTQAAYDVLRDGEVVEIGYKPNTRFVLYVAYGPALSSTRNEKELRVAVTLDPAERSVFEEQILPGFKKRTGFDVTFLQMEADTLTGVLEQGSGAPFDLVAVDNNRIGQLAAEDLVQDLSRDADLIPHEVIPSMLPLTQSGGRTLFFPFRPNVMVTYYDQPKVAQLGIGPPRTWDELLAAGATLENHGNGLVLQGARGSPSATQLDEFLLQAGGDPLALDSPASLNALEFLRELAPYLDPHTANAKFDTMNTYLADGDAVVAPNWTFGVSEVVVKQHKSNLGVYPGWAGPAGEGHVLGGDVLAIPKGAERRRAALDLSEYLMSQHVQATLANELFWPAIRADAYRDAQPQLRPYWQAINEAMAHATPRPTLACWPQVENVLSRVWTAIVKGDASPTQVAARRSAEIHQLCDRVPTATSAPNHSQNRTRTAEPEAYDITDVLLAGTSAIALGPDGNLWFTKYSLEDRLRATNGSIGRTTTDGEITTFKNHLRLGPDGIPDGITAGPDGNLWFSESDNGSIGRITVGGEITTFKDRALSGPEGITAGPDGNLWFTDYVSGLIGRITVGGEITTFKDRALSGPEGITAGPDGNLWFTDSDNGSIGRITVDGEITMFKNRGLLRRKGSPQVQTASSGSPTRTAA